MQAIYVDKHIPRLLAVKALKHIWPNVVFSPLSPARFAHWPDPPLPGARWVRVRNRLCGICASDIALLMAEADPYDGWKWNNLGMFVRDQADALVYTGLHVLPGA